MDAKQTADLPAAFWQGAFGVNIPVIDRRQTDVIYVSVKNQKPHMSHGVSLHRFTPEF